MIAMNANTSKKFCLVTPGRAASTALMNVIADSDVVAVPNKNIECPNNELVQHRFVKKYKKLYAELSQTPIKTNRELINQFFLYNQQYAFVGFKTMPLRHKDDPGFFLRDDIQFIVLSRNDIPSTVASFLHARKANTWNRTGGSYQGKLGVGWFDKLLMWGNVRYIRDSLAVINKIKKPIQISYEELCSPAFSNAELNELFGRTIKLDNPSRPTSGEAYVENWDEFKRFVERWY
jgi:hypothetical protein